MGIFAKLKNIFKKDIDDSKDIKVYEKGLEKTREEFVSKLNFLGIKYTKVNEEYFEELEDILIMADIGVKTVMNFIEKLRARVKEEKIDNPEELKEVIVDELFIIYVNNEVLSDKIKIADNGPTVILMVGVNGWVKRPRLLNLLINMLVRVKKS